ncbi:probable prolyl 4-hydroxylase 7 [Impatiens glandulifera]|uniref:probable prolyl 4-hydroxylase 7 n=1 Tax=Impatiens glandulifera TaxID=253017 RepID=UPI001FB07DE6|nr:probable prolyl 4-hydroxylase 7 [Impatiens glandulifera]
MDSHLSDLLLIILSFSAALNLNESSASPVDPTRVTQISWHPRAFIYKGFLSEEECDHFIHLAKGKLEKSVVTDFEYGNVLSKTRTSSGMFLQPAQDKIVADIETRISSWTFLPEENGEPIQVVHYEIGEKYESHYDNFVEEANLGGINNSRIATVLMYLSNVDKGGETVFPFSEKKDIVQSKDDNSYSECASRGYAVKPRKGDALLFFSLNINLTRDLLSLHCSCPVIEGEKWAATKWIGVGPYKNKPPPEEAII